MYKGNFDCLEARLVHVEALVSRLISINRQIGQRVA
jgi:hypothetical protein